MSPRSSPLSTPGNAPRLGRALLAFVVIIGFCTLTEDGNLRLYGSLPMTMLALCPLLNLRLPRLRAMSAQRCNSAQAGLALQVNRGSEIGHIRPAAG